MNPELKTWLTLFGTLALETTAVLAVAAILAARMRHGSWRRFVWQGGLCATLLLSVGELSGFNRALTVRVQPKQAAVALPAAKPTPVEPTASTSERKISVRVLERSGTTDTFSLPTEASSNSVSLWLPVLWLVGSAFILGRSAVCRLVFSPDIS